MSAPRNPPLEIVKQKIKVLEEINSCATYLLKTAILKTTLFTPADVRLRELFDEYLKAFRAVWIYETHHFKTTEKGIGKRIALVLVLEKIKALYGA